MSDNTSSNAAGVSSFSFPVWMPAARKHELAELVKQARALAKDKPYSVKPYQHVKGRVSATMDHALYVKTIGEIRAQGLNPFAGQPATQTGSYFDGAQWHATEDAYRAAVERIAAQRNAAEQDRMIEECASAERQAA